MVANAECVDITQKNAIRLSFFIFMLSFLCWHFKTLFVFVSKQKFLLKIDNCLFYKCDSNEEKVKLYG